MLRRSRRTQNKPPEIVPRRSDEEQDLQEDSDTGELETNTDDDNAQDASGDDGESEEPVAPSAVRRGRRSQRGRRLNSKSGSASPANVSPTGKSRGRGGGSNSSPASEVPADSVAVPTSDPLSSKRSGRSGKDSVKKQENEGEDQTSNTKADEESDSSDNPPNEALGTEDHSPVPALAVTADKARTKRGSNVGGTVGDKRGGRKSEPLKPPQKDDPVVKGRKPFSDLGTLAKSPVAPVTGNDTASVTDEKVEQQGQGSVGDNNQNNDFNEGMRRPSRKRKLTAKAAAAATASENVDVSIDAVTKEGHHDDDGESLENVEGVKKKVKGESGESEFQTSNCGTGDTSPGNAVSIDAPYDAKKLSDKELKEAENIINTAGEEAGGNDTTKPGPAILTSTGAKQGELEKIHQGTTGIPTRKEKADQASTTPKSIQHTVVAEQTISTSNSQHQVSGSGRNLLTKEAKNRRESLSTDAQGDAPGQVLTVAPGKGDVPPSISNPSTIVSTQRIQSSTSAKTSDVTDEFQAATSTLTNVSRTSAPSLKGVELVSKSLVPVDKENSGSDKLVTLTMENGSKDALAILDSVGEFGPRHEAALTEERTSVQQIAGEGEPKGGKPSNGSDIAEEPRSAKGTAADKTNKAPLLSNDGKNSIRGNSRSGAILTTKLGDDQLFQNDGHAEEDDCEATAEASTGNGSMLTKEPPKERDDAKDHKRDDTSKADFDVEDGTFRPAERLPKGNSLELVGDISDLKLDKGDDSRANEASMAKRSARDETSKNSKHGDANKAGIVDPVHPSKMSVDVVVSRVDTDASGHVNRIADQIVGALHEPQSSFGGSNPECSTRGTSSAQTAQPTDLQPSIHPIQSANASIISSEAQPEMAVRDVNGMNQALTLIHDQGEGQITDFSISENNESTERSDTKSILKSAHAIPTPVLASLPTSSLVDSNMKEMPHREIKILELARLGKRPDDGDVAVDAENDESGKASGPSIQSKSKKPQTDLLKSSWKSTSDEKAVVLVGANNIEQTSATVTGTIVEQLATKALAQTKSEFKADESVGKANDDLDVEKSKSATQTLGTDVEKATNRSTVDTSTPKCDVHQEKIARGDFTHSSDKEAQIEVSECPISVLGSMTIESHESSGGGPEVSAVSPVDSMKVLSTLEKRKSETQEGASSDYRVEAPNSDFGNDTVVVSNTQVAALKGFTPAKVAIVVDGVEGQIDGVNLSLENRHKTGGKFEASSGVDNQDRPNPITDSLSFTPLRNATEPEAEVPSQSASNTMEGISTDQGSDTPSHSVVNRKRTLEETVDGDKGFLDVEDATAEVLSPAPKRPRVAWITLSRMRRKVITVDQTPSFSGYDVNKLTGVKIHLFNAGSKVHRGRGFERLFSTYWDAVCLRLSDRLSSHTSERCDEAINSFLKSRKLRRMHNRFIMSIMKRTTRVLVPYPDISEHIPHKWRDRVKVKIIESIVTPEIDEDLASPAPENTSLIFAEVPHVDLEDPYKETWNFVSNDSDSSREVSEPKGMESTSPCIPGAIVVDPLLREAAEAKGLKVTNNAVWILIVALREHTRNVLKNSMVLKKALESGQVYPPALHYPNVLAFSTRKDGKQHEKPSAPVKQSGPKRLINCMDILAAAERLPSGQIGSSGGSVSRLSLEQSFQTAFNSIPSCIADNGFRYVQHFVSNELMSIANNLKFDALQQTGDPPMTTRTRPQSHLPSVPQINATYPQSASHYPRDPSYIMAGSSQGGQPQTAVAPVSTSIHDSLPMQVNRNTLGDSTPPGPKNSSAVEVSRHEVPFQQSTSSRPDEEGTRQASSAPQYPVPLVSSAAPAVTEVYAAAPISFQPPVTKDVKTSALRDGPHRAPLMTSSQQSQVQQDDPHSESARVAQRPSMRGMGRGAKDLAALMSRTASASSTNPHSSESSQPVGAATPTGTGSEENDMSVGGGNTNKDGKSSATHYGSDSEVAKSSSSAAVATASGELIARGKGSGTKDLAAMRARAAGASPIVDRTAHVEGGGEPQLGSDEAKTSIGSGGAGFGDTMSNSA